MSNDMWTTITLDDFEVRPLDQWPPQDKLSYFDHDLAKETLDEGGSLREYVYRVMVDTLDNCTWDGDSNEVDGSFYAAGWSKYQTDDGHSLAAELTEVTTGTATIREEWFGDEPDINETVYRNGKQDRAASKHSQLVPDNLGDLIQAGRAALDSLDKSRTEYQEADEDYEGDSEAYENWEDSVMDVHIDEVSSALDALLMALDPRPAP